jgi:hypothetical protein
MMATAGFVDGTALDFIADAVGLAIAVATFVGLIWGAVMWATRPLRKRLDEISNIATELRAERARVDDLANRTADMERRLGAIERRLEHLYDLIAGLFDPRRFGVAANGEGKHDG